MDPIDAGYDTRKDFDPRKDLDMYSANEDLRDYSDSDQPYEMKVGKTPYAKEQKRIEKKAKKLN